MDLDGMTLLVRSGVGALDTRRTRSPSSSARQRTGRRPANNIAGLNAHLKSLLLEAAGQDEKKVRG